MAKEQWMLYAKKADFKGIGERFGIDQVTARIIRNRDIVGEGAIEAYLSCDASRLHDPHLFHDMEKGTSLLVEKIRQGKKIRVIGDYDIDGVNASYILLKGLGRCGADADYMIPDRVKDGYGMNQDMVRRVAADGVDTILTCDNGISALEEIRLAKELGLTVIVTDHHEVPYQMEGGDKHYLLPPADAVINPKQAGCSYPYPGLCGAAVAWKLIQVLYEKMDVPAEESMEMIAHVAFATVGDVMDLTGENRLLVQLGLNAIHKTNNPGLRALILKNDLEQSKIKAWHFGFVLGPCINASGRLDTARHSLELLLETDMDKALELAGKLVELNQRRKDLTAQGVEQAKQAVLGQGMGQDKVLVIYLPNCHESIAGIIAGRIREWYYKPVFIMTDAEDGGIKGSGRSIEAYSMYDELIKCKDLMTKFGGHPMAAGLSMERKNLEEFRRRMNANAALKEEDFIEKIHIDVPMPFSYIRTDLIREFERLEPFGKGNEKPVFAVKNVHPLQAKILGKNQNVLRMKLEDESGCRAGGVYFGDVGQFLDFLREKYSSGQVDALMQGKAQEIYFSMIYDPAINVFQGREEIQVIIRHYT